MNVLLANVCRQNVTRFPDEIAPLAQEIAGGLLGRMPSEADLSSPEVGPGCRRAIDEELTGY